MRMLSGKPTLSRRRLVTLTTTDTGHTPVDLAGQVALVTGGGRGLGRAFALGLAKAGASVAVTARTAVPLAETVEIIERAGGRALAIPGDVAESGAAAHVVSTAESRLGPLDILVNNAGVMGPVGYDWNVDPEDWWRTFEVNMRGPFLCARAVLPGMLARRRGRLVNISSGAAFNRLPQMAVYSRDQGRIDAVDELSGPGGPGARRCDTGLCSRICAYAHDGAPYWVVRSAEGDGGPLPRVPQRAARHADRAERADVALPGLGKSGFAIRPVHPR